MMKILEIEIFTKQKPTKSTTSAKRRISFVLAQRSMPLYGQKARSISSHCWSSVVFRNRKRKSEEKICSVARVALLFFISHFIFYQHINEIYSSQKFSLGSSSVLLCTQIYLLLTLFCFFVRFSLFSSFLLRRSLLILIICVALISCAIGRSLCSFGNICVEFFRSFFLPSVHLEFLEPLLSQCYGLVLLSSFH